MSAQAKQALTLSLIIPAYNEENYLAGCLESIAKQTVMPDEVILVNNNSTDRTLAIAAAYPFVKIVHEKHQGIVFARNKGFNAAAGDIIARIDADTVLPYNWTARVSAFYSHPRNLRKALTGGGYFYNIRAKRFNGWVQNQLAYRMNKLILGHYILWGSNMALTRQQWLNVKPKVCQRDDIHEDLDLAIHLHRLGYEIYYRPSLRVGVMLKRVYHDRSKLRGHMARWPRTLRVHHYHLWWMGTLGNGILWWIIQPMLYGAEYGSRYILRRKPLDD